MTQKKRVETWLVSNYTGQFQTIRAIWYAMKPEVQEYVTDKQATRIIGNWLWNRFVEGDNTIYGMIGNSHRVHKRDLPIVLSCEKNTLDVFGWYGDHTYASEYISSGQSNSYELANIIEDLRYRYSEIWLYVASDFDKAGDIMARTLYEKFGKFFTVHFKRLDVDINSYETYIQPNGKIGLELDAITNIEELVASDLEEFLPYGLFEEVAIQERKAFVHADLKEYDEEYLLLESELMRKDYELKLKADSMTYRYHLPAKLDSIKWRVEVTA